MPELKRPSTKTGLKRWMTRAKSSTLEAGFCGWDLPGAAAIHAGVPCKTEGRRSPPQGRRAHPRVRQREGPGGYELSRSDDEGDAGRDGVSGRERNLQEADSASAGQIKDFTNQKCLLYQINDGDR